MLLPWEAIFYSRFLYLPRFSNVFKDLFLSAEVEPTIRRQMLFPIMSTRFDYISLSVWTLRFHRMVTSAFYTNRGCSCSHQFCFRKRLDARHISQCIYRTAFSFWTHPDMVFLSLQIFITKATGWDIIKFQRIILIVLVFNCIDPLQ